MSFDERVASIPVHVRSDTPLVQETAEGPLPILFWFVEGAIHVHPDRLNDVRVLLVAGRLPFRVPSRTG